jgi:hypothetical protein
MKMQTALMDRQTKSGWKKFAHLALAFCLFIFICRPMAADILNPAPVHTFDGKTWSGLVLREMTLGEVRKVFKTENLGNDLTSRMRPYFDENSLRCEVPKDSPVLVNAIMEGSGNKDRLAAIRIHFLRDAPTIADLASSLGEQPVKGYVAGHADWWVETFPHHGIVGIVAAGAQETRLQSAVLAMPERVQSLITTLSAAPTQPLTDPTRPAPPVTRPSTAEFGNVTVVYKLKGVVIKDQDKDRQEWEERLKSATAGGKMKYVPGSGGEYAVTIDAQKIGSNILLNISSEFNSSGPASTHASSFTLQTIPDSISGGIGGGITYTAMGIGVLKETEKQVREHMDGASVSASALASGPVRTSISMQQISHALGRPFCEHPFEFGSVAVEAKGDHFTDEKAAAFAVKGRDDVLKMIGRSDALQYRPDFPGSLKVSLILNGLGEKLHVAVEVTLDATQNGKSVNTTWKTPGVLSDIIRRTAAMRPGSDFSTTVLQFGMFTFQKEMEKKAR